MMSTATTTTTTTSASSSIPVAAAMSTTLMPSQAIRSTTQLRQRPSKGRGSGGGGQKASNKINQNSSPLQAEGTEGQNQQQEQQQNHRAGKGGGGRPPPNNAKNHQSQVHSSPSPPAEGQQEPEPPAGASSSSSSGKAKKNRRKKNKVNTNASNSNNKDENPPPPVPLKTNTDTTNHDTNNNNSNKKKKNNNNKRQRQQRLHYPWRKHIPPGSVDPITLESLKSLPYPPFCMVATEPYHVVEEWPPVSASTTTYNEEEEGSAVVVDNNNSRSVVGGGETEQERHERILREQWGDKLTVQTTETTTTTATTTNGAVGATSSSAAAAAASTVVAPPVSSPNSIDNNSQKRHYHLYDGRALAYYCVSQLQFIDPLNRRDLTRDELVHLDRYLRRHGFLDLNVTEAYDSKGITLSTAGAAGNTAAGRAAILQQEARVLLNALFGGGRGRRTTTTVTSATATTTTAATSTTAPAPSATLMSTRSTSNNNNLRSQYQAHEEAQQQQQHELYHHAQATAAAAISSLQDGDVGIYADEDGAFAVIDDDLNPGLRSSTSEFVPQHLRRHHQQQPLQSQQARAQAAEFPSLAETIPAAAKVAPSSAQQQPQPPPPSLPKSSTLVRIATSVKKTDPQEQQRQWEAREEARRKAMLSNLTFGSNMAAWEQPSLLQPPQLPFSVVTANDAATAAVSTAPLSEAQLQRNKSLATALGVAPAIMRLQQQQPVLVGWARPTDPRGVGDELDEFGKELLYSTAVYPDSLILQAKEKMGFLLKLERKFIKFLADDTAPSLPLNPMDRPTRAMVHEYTADFWKLQTHSYDPEPRRYIHCSKLLDTAAPHPLLSDAARNWKGPISTYNADTINTMAASHQQPLLTVGREIPAAPPRVPLPLKPRSGSLERRRCPLEGGGGVSIGGAPTTRSAGADGTNSRVESILSDRERPKLHLSKRSLPLELPPYQPPPQQHSFDVSEELQRRKERMEEMARKEQESMRKQQQALEAAFASDDEDVDGGGNYDDSEWEEREALYTGSSHDGDW